MVLLNLVLFYLRWFYVSNYSSIVELVYHYLYFFYVAVQLQIFKFY